MSGKPRADYTQWITRNLTATDDAADWPEPQPLHTPEAAPALFPLAALGPLIPAIEAIQVATQAPLGLVGASVLSVANFAAIAVADVALWGGMRRPLSLMILTEGVSGERKSAVDTLAMIGIETYQQERLASWRVLRAQCEAGDTEAEPGAAPFVKLSDASLQGIEAGFRQGPAAQYLASDEAGRFLGGYAMKMENRLNAIATLSQHWDGKTLTKRLRGNDSKSGETTYLQGCRLALHLMGQREVLQPFLSDPVARGQGILARFLVHAPKSTIGTRLTSSEQFQKPSTSREVMDFADRIRAVLNTAPERDPVSQEIERPIMQLDASAVETITAFANQIEHDMRRGGRFGDMVNLVNKAPEQAGRIAATLAVMRGTREITAETMQAGVSLAEYFICETRRLAQRADADPTIIKAEKLADYLLKSDGAGCTLNDILRKGPAATRKKSDRDAALDVLTDAGWVRVDGNRCAINPNARP